MKKLIIAIVILWLLSSCSFNGMFLQPTVLPGGVKRLTFKTGTDSTVVMYDTKTRQPTFLKNGKDVIDMDHTIESVVYKSTNGHMLNGWMMKPKNKPITATILHLHGNAGCLLSQYQAMTPLLKYGFQIFIFDYSGFGFSEGKATRDNVLTDALASFEYLKNRSDVKNTKLIIYGQSLGGHLSAVVGTMKQNEIDALVIEGAFSSHKDIAAHMVPVLGRIFVKQGYSAKKWIKGYHKPLLVIHSTEDETIPFSLGKKLFEAANTRKQFFEIKHPHIRGPEYYAAEIAAKMTVMINTK